MSGMDSENHLLTGRPFGGIGILWKKSISKFVKAITFDDSRLLGVQITDNQETFVFINVYLPFHCEYNYENYLNYLGKLTAVVEEIATSNIVVLGDFNAAKDTKFENELLLWCNSNNCIMSDKEILGDDLDTHTYVSDAHCTTSWLDHIVCSFDMHSKVSSVHVIDKMPCSDHLPIVAAFDICNNLYKVQSRKVDKDPDVVRFNWYKADTNCIKEYGNVSQQLLNKVSFPKEAMNCSNTHCTDAAHRHGINILYADICAALLDASTGCIEKGKGSNNEHMVPGWNDSVTDLHAEARDAYVLWRNFGKPRFGPLCQLMRRTRLSFKYAIRQVKRNEDRARADALAKDLESKNDKSF